MRVRDAMTSPALTVAADDTCQHAAQLMRSHGTGMLVVVTPEGLLEGVITDRDLVVNCVARGLDPSIQRIGGYFDRHPVHVDADLELERAVAIMRNGGVHRVPVVDGAARVVGVLSLDDVAIDVKHYVDAFLALAGQYSKHSH